MPNFQRSIPNLCNFGNLPFLATYILSTYTAHSCTASLSTHLILEMLKLGLLGLKFLNKTQRSLNKIRTSIKNRHHKN